MKKRAKRMYLFMLTVTIFLFGFTEVHGRELTDEELEEWGVWLSEWSNYGFLMSDYETIEDVDLSLIYHNGAGIIQETLTSAEKELYRREFGSMNLVTDICKLTTKQINEHLLEKTGLTLEEMNHTLDWYYIPETDSWYRQSGDTNYVRFTCMNGMIDKNGTYEITYESDFSWKSGTVILQEEGEEIFFVSNKLQEQEIMGE